MRISEREGERERERDLANLVVKGALMQLIR